MNHHLATTLWTDLFMLHQPVLEKVLRPALMYILLVGFLRLFGKRELAQLNPFDLVVLLTLSNTVQNAIIGDDNTLLGGAIGALALLTVNWLVSKATYKLPRFNAALQGSASTLIRDGQVDGHVMEQETLTHEELISVLNKNGFGDPGEVKICRLEPNGTFFVKGVTPSPSDRETQELREAIRALSEQVLALRQDLRMDLRGDPQHEISQGPQPGG